MNLWRKRGGRKRNPTLAEKRALTGKQYPTAADWKAVSGPAGKRVKQKAGGSLPPATNDGGVAGDPESPATPSRGGVDEGGMPIAERA